jgi:DNA-binding NarL/FixJ family response regulator
MTGDQETPVMNATNAPRCRYPAKPRELDSPSDLCNVLESTGCPLAHWVGERMRFETLLAELSMMLVNLPADRVDSRIESALQRLVDAIAEFKPCLVVVDLSLPDSGEVNIARRLMERHPELRLIIFSVHDEPTVASQVRATGAAGFVLKRTAATDLVAAIREVLRGRAYVPRKYVRPPRDNRRP